MYNKFQSMDFSSTCEWHEEKENTYMEWSRLKSKTETLNDVIFFLWTTEGEFWCDKRNDDNHNWLTKSFVED